MQIPNTTKFYMYTCMPYFISFYIFKQAVLRLLLLLLLLLHRVRSSILLLPRLDRFPYTCGWYQRRAGENRRPSSCPRALAPSIPSCLRPNAQCM